MLLISRALRYGPCVATGSQFYLPPTHDVCLSLLRSPSCATYVRVFDSAVFVVVGHSSVSVCCSTTSLCRFWKSTTK